MKYLCADCGRTLETERVEDALMVVPCAHCLEAAEDRAAHEGMDEGIDRGLALRSSRRFRHGN